MNTLYDLVSRVLDARDGYNDPASVRRALRASIWGADQVTQRHAWSDYHTDAIFLQNAPVEIEASVDSAGVITLDSGTLPTWTAQSSVAIQNRLYVIAKRSSDTVAVILNYAGPAVASSTLTLVHDRLIIRDDVRQIYCVRHEREETDLIFVRAPAFNIHQLRQNAVPSEPTVVTTARVSSNGARHTELRLSPAPVSDTTIRVSYFRTARKATVMHDCGQVSIDSGDLALVTISNQIRVSELFDLQLVLSDNAQVPDADLGFSVADANPAIATLPVSAIASATTLTLEDDYQEIDGKGAMLTQLLDLPPHASEAAAMYAEAKYLQIGNQSHGDFWQTIQMADAEMRTAMEQEAVLARDSSGGPRVAIYTRPEILVGVDP